MESKAGDAVKKTSHYAVYLFSPSIINLDEEEKERIIK